MSEVHRYRAVKMQTEVGNNISYNPHGPEIVLAADFDRVIAERDALQQRLTAADQQIDELTQERERLIAYGRSCGLDEASTLCSRMAYDAYYPAGSRFKVFTPKAQKALGDLLIKAANEIASLPGGPYERFKARQAKTAESAKSR
ncbi:hypothetical protein [Pseudomonas reactans]